jgi:transcriptional regulator with XRE-family HTH domain
MPEEHFATNLRRLLLFEHRSGKEAAEALGVTDASVSRWLTGKRYPSAQVLIAIERLYGVSPRELDDDPVDFAQRLADPARIKYAEATRRRVTKKGELTAADAKVISDRAKADTEAAVDRRKVVSIKGRGKK